MADSPPILGKTVSRYRILEKLGGGGMGVVYKAEDKELGRFVALKFLPDDLAGDSQALERFRREARAASALNHPNICTIYEIGEHDGKRFIAMEFLEGASLKHLIQERLLKTEQMLDLSIEIADALDAAHAKSIIHRDIKPANIFVTQRGQAKVLDFGLAKVTGKNIADPLDMTAATVDESDEMLTSPGSAIGTIAYMSPEQVRGETLDARSDLFSFGVVLYEMATGQRPFAGDTSGVTFDSILNRQPVSPVRINPAISPEIERIINKGLEKDREVRYQNASDIRADLKRFRRDSQTGKSAAQGIVASRPSKFPVPIVSAVCVVVLLLAGGFIFKRGWIRPRQQRQLVERNITANPSDNTILMSSISPDGKQIAYVELATGLSLLQVDSGEKRSLSRDATLRPASWYPDGTHLLLGGPGSGWLWKMSTVDGTTRKLFEDKMGFVVAAVSPDGTKVAFESILHLGEIWTMGPDGEDPRRILTAGSFGRSVIMALDWSSTSKRIVFSQDNVTPDKQEVSTIESCDRDGGQRTLILSDDRLRSSGGGTISWSSDGRVFFVFQELRPNAKDANIWSMEVDPDTGHALGKPSRVTSGTGFTQEDLSQSADGKRLIFEKAQERDTIQVAEIQSGGAGLAKPRPVSNDNWSKWLDGWTSDGQGLVFESAPQGKWGIFEENVRTHEVRTLVSGPNIYIYDTPVVSPDGQWLLFTQTSHGDTTGASAQLMRMPMNGGAATALLSGKFDYACAPKAAVCVLSEIANGQRVFSTLDPLKGRGPFLGKADATSKYDSWSLSYDGKRIAAVSESDSSHIQIINTEGEGKNLIKLDGFSLQSVSWSPDNQHLYVSGASDASFKILLLDLDGKFKGLAEFPIGQAWPSAPKPSPDGRYLAYFVRLYEHNLALLENY